MEKRPYLEGHDLVVSGIDWCAETNKIVSCSHDRNAFVWTLVNGEWKPTLSILRINRAALSARWSPDGSKFAIASGAKVVPVCHYDQANDNDWWVSKMIKKHKSTIVDIAWHPNSQLLATACCDFKCRVFSAYMDIDTPVDSIFGDLGATAFGDLLAEFDSSNGWVESVAWSPSGNRLAFAGHDSTVSVVQFNSTPDVPPTTQVIKLRNLPETSLMFATEDIIVAGGHSFNPSVFQADDSGKWSFIENLDKKSEAKAATTKSSGFSAARSMWASKVNRGQSNAASNKDDKLWTKHSNAITCMKPYTKSGADAVQFSTSGIDGNIVVWDLKTLASSLSSLKL